MEHETGRKNADSGIYLGSNAGKGRIEFCFLQPVKTNTTRFLYSVRNSVVTFKVNKRRGGSYALTLGGRSVPNESRLGVQGPGAIQQVCCQSHNCLNKANHLVCSVSQGPAHKAAHYINKNFNPPEVGQIQKQSSARRPSLPN